MAFVGVDIGTQSLKAIVTDDALHVLGSASIAYRPHFPQAGWAEQDPKIWMGAIGLAIGRALEQAGIGPQAVRALGIAGQLDGCIPTDASGAALAPCIVWMDRRADREIADVSADVVRHRAGLVLDASHMAAKIRWFERNDPNAARVRTWHQPTSYLVERLTGERVFDHGIASTTMLYNVRTRAFDPQLLDAFGIDAARLPRIDEAGNVAGRLSDDGARFASLVAGTPVAVGTGDDFSNPLGAGVLDPGRLACSLGTAEALGAVSDTPVIDDGALVETHGWFGGRSYISNPGWLSGGAVTWFCDTFSVDSPQAMSQLAATAPMGSDGVTFLPALSGAMAPRWIANARGTFHGMTAKHGKAELARAVLEGCACAMRDVLDRLRALDVPIESIRLVGGGARSAVWADIRATLANLPVETSAVTDTSPLGAAALAAQAVNGGALVAPDAGPFRVIEPQAADRQAAEAAYARYHRLFEALAPMYQIS